MTWRALLVETEQRLRTAGFASPDMEARWLVEEASGLPRATLVAGLDQPAAPRCVARLDALVDRRSAGEPLQYVLGRWGFRRLDLLVDRRVLIPRPETEQVVEEALAELDLMLSAESTLSAKLGSRVLERPVESTSNRRRGATVVDLGCGSGAIGLSIATEREGTTVWCVDVAPDALAVTRANLAGIGAIGAQVAVLEGSWFEPLPAQLKGAVDLIVTNPPYVAAADRLPAEVADWEPVEALVAGRTGLEAIEEILGQAPAWLEPGGSLVTEIGESQGVAVAAAAMDAGFAHVEVRPDLAGRDRILVARLTWPGPTANTT